MEEQRNLLDKSWLTPFSTILGVRCKNGIVLGTEKIVVNKMLIPGTDKRIFSISPQIGSVKFLVNRYRLLMD